MAFATSLRVVWEVLLAIAALGLASSLLMKALPLHSAVDDRWMLEREVSSEGKGSITTMTTDA